MARQPYLPKTDAGILQMLTSFYTNATNNGGALATKYSLAAGDLARITQAQIVWGWFLGQLDALRNAAQGFTQTRDEMFTGTGAPVDIQTIIQLATVPNHLDGTVMVPSQLDPGFFPWFFNLVQGIKTAPDYDVADGVLLGIEGAEQPAPDPNIVPILTGDLSGSGQPILTCKKGQFQGWDIYLTKPTQAKRKIGFSTSRHWTCDEPLPAAGTAEIWTFEVQYRYQDAPFGMRSTPLPLTVRGS